MKIPRSHPRYESLMRREKLVRGWREGLVVPEGLIAQGRGEAFDYLLGETTSAPALVAERAATAFFLKARRAVISVNGNVAALASREVVRLAKAVPARIEVNLFHRTDARVSRIAKKLRAAGAPEILGLHPDARIPGLESKRALSDQEGIFGADVVLVPLEDGDRTEALVRMGKTVVSIDLNPLSRTSRKATIPIVDELTRALVNMERFTRALRNDPKETARLVRSYRKTENMKALYAFMDWRLRDLRTGTKAMRELPRRPHRSLASKD
jgi:4-phosphopantoate--beta-alanine ligase